MTGTRILLADPPWRYGDSLSMDPLVARSAEDQYETMTVDEVCALGGRHNHVAGFEIDDPAILFLWITNPFLITGDGAKVCRAWGFEPKQLVTWIKTKTSWISLLESLTEGGESFDFDPEEVAEMTVKPLEEQALQFGMGRITRGVTEHMIIATRGKYSHLVKSHSKRNIFFAPRTTHSKKPDCQYDLIESLFDGPYVELFATQRRDGWISWGNSLPKE